VKPNLKESFDANDGKAIGKSDISQALSPAWL
jgi:hypothetical protein